MTTATAKIEAQLEQFPEGSVRRRVLECARRFKASWVDLGRLLCEVRDEALWKGWGYPGFETYCAKELFLRRQTVEKLTRSYGFLSRHEPALVREQPPTSAPSFEVIEVLSRAEASGRLPDEGWREIKDEILEKAPTPAAVNRQLSERYGPRPPPPRAPAEERLRKLAALAARLASACASEEGVPRAVAERAQALVEDIEALL
ncbi:MAG TPA: hypothetical protein VLV17_04760 [Anaeromyxobacteraceae bacterium]|nr:hypothetical protein [Anaeromyxobacteraceae bacterium]